ncbi:hypothetical protein E2C01_083493 [Portunus trituberculatus]|uniref:Uncharacterized protein n=1 Tax=Portunus trituberculatus TaxID=210409 RepID=A0A5B7J1X3_PORTR|nr:hypothetical protein [Portunus trituberculatus]
MLRVRAQLVLWVSRVYLIGHIITVKQKVGQLGMLDEGFVEFSVYPSRYCAVGDVTAVCCGVLGLRRRPQGWVADALTVVQPLVAPWCT